MILAIDVDYDDNTKEAWVSGVLFDEAESETSVSFHSHLTGVAEYVCGEFYKRELPCIEKLLSEHKLNPEIIIVDGFCQLNNKPCLGELLHLAYPHIKVIGVAKNPHPSMNDECRLLRGESAKPLLVSSAGLTITEAKAFVAKMHGKFRIPYQLKYVDSQCRARLSNS
ncbi:endonuclease V [Vibrio splendidus]|nr:endonuclease V [Vibrio splendidus]MCC4880325.1 endonuclease V [Vibrio splendidus]